MPANPKYLTPGFWPRFTKITAAILGGYLVTISFHMMLASWLDKPNVTITSAFTGFMLWVALMIVAFLAKSGLKIWGIYLVLTLVFSAILYAGL